MLSCRFAHNVSLWADGREFWIAGVSDPNNAPFTDIYRVPDIADIIGLVNVDERVVHILTSRRSVYQFDGILREIGRLP